MMRRFNEHLLTRYPLLWNMRIQYVLPAILLFHVAFYIWGYYSANYPGTELYQMLTPADDRLLFLGIFAILLAIGWLFLYLRNNAFRSFYPLKPGRLAAELGLIFGIALGISSLKMSYIAGKAGHIRSMSAGIGLEDEWRTVLLAEHFLPFDAFAFSRTWEAADTLGANEEDQEPRIQTEHTYLSEMNFVGLSVEPDTVHEKVLAESNRLAEDWLLTGKQDSVLAAIRRYLKLVGRYGGKYLFYPRTHVATIFGTPDFALTYVLVPEDISGQYMHRYKETGGKMIPSPVLAIEGQYPALRYPEWWAFIERYRPRQALLQIEMARKPLWTQYEFRLMLDLGLIFTFVVFGFRLTGLRVWAPAMIGLTLMVAVILAVRSVTKSVFAANSLIALAALLFSVYAFYGVRNGLARRRMGIVYLWALIGLPFILPSLIRAIAYAVPEGHATRLPGMFVMPRVDAFLSGYQDLLLIGNVGVCLLLVLLAYIPLARVWRAMPEA